MSTINWKDLLYKTFWTALSAALGVAATVVADLEAAYAPVLIAAVNAALAWVRQQLGATPPDAPPVGPLANP